MHANELTKAQLEEVVNNILGGLYADGPDTEWTADTPSEIADIQENAGLELAPPKKFVTVPDDPNAVLLSFINDIQYTGGVKPDGNGCWSVIADEEWTDLGDTYVRACKALGREPKVVGDDDPRGIGCYEIPDSYLTTPSVCRTTRPLFDGVASNGEPFLIPAGTRVRIAATHTSTTGVRLHDLVVLTEAGDDDPRDVRYESALDAFLAVS